MSFKDFYVMVQEKAGERIDKDAAKILWERGIGIMDAVLKLVNRR